MGHVACIGQMRSVYKLLVRREETSWEDLGVSGKIVLELSLGK